jgi:GT2 family glycosyltransferase
MEPKPNETFVVTVTYGNRHQYVAKLVEGARRCGAGGVVVVENGCDAESLAELERMTADSGGYVTLLELRENRGSAGGFREGIRYAHEQAKYPYIWLLDDDNVPRPEALDELLRAYAQLRARHHGTAISLLSVRETKRWVWRVAHGESPEKVTLRRNSFCNLHVADVFARIGKRLWRNTHSMLTDPVALRFATYGGLWMPAEVVSAIGYPDEYMYLYADDTEYSGRIPARNAKLFLVPSSRVDDIELSWYAEPSLTHGFSRILLAESDARVYYTTRNKVYFECHVRDNDGLLQSMNEAVFWVLLYLFAFLYDRPQRRDLIRRAVLEGKSARLGKSLAPPSTGQGAAA